MRVELLTVGDELLRGETLNTNAAWLGRQLTDRGSTVTRVTVVPDAVEVIADVLTTARGRADAVVVTGGLGPTHDDRTMAAVARSFGVDLVEHAGARDWFVEETEHDPDDLAPGTLDLPAGATSLPNEVGIAPGAAIANVYVLPGVPEEMHRMFEGIARAFEGPDHHVRQLTVGQPEREIADLLRQLEGRFDVVVGSYPGETVRVRIAGADHEDVEAAAAWLAERVTLA